MIVRHGKDKADICAEFDTVDIEIARTWLEQNDLSYEQASTCILRRVVSKDGRSKAYINGTAVTMKNLKDLGEMLLDIHSQHEHQSLLKRQHIRGCLTIFVWIKIKRKTHIHLETMESEFYRN